MGFLDFFKRKEKPLLKVKPLKRTKEKVALCLGGGGARIFAHIGAIKAFEEEDIDFDLCVGTSAGSIVGAMYCAGIKSDEMIAYSSTISMKDVHNGVLFMPNDPAKLGLLVSRLLGDAKIENLKKQFAAVAVDLVEARQVVLNSGSVASAVSASACVPIFFRPVIRGAAHLVDGGLLNNIPSDVCRMLGANHVVTVDINPTRGGGTAETGIIDVVKATFNIMSANASVQGLLSSDVIIAPDMSKFKATSKEGWEEMIQLGYDETKKKINEIKLLMFH